MLSASPGVAAIAVVAALAVIVWCGAFRLRHEALSRRVTALEEAFREDRMRGKRIEDGVGDLKASLKHLQELQNIIIQEHMRAAR